MRERRSSELTISSTVIPEKFCVNCKNNMQRRRYYMLILKSFFCTAVVVLCMFKPMGDPSYNCKKNNLSQCCNVTALSNTYYGLKKAVYVTVTTLDVVLSYLGESLYKAKLSAYDILSKIDNKDLCYSACEKDKIVHVCNNAMVRKYGKFYKMPRQSEDFIWE